MRESNRTEGKGAGGGSHGEGEGVEGVERDMSTVRYVGSHMTQTGAREQERKRTSFCCPVTQSLDPQLQSLGSPMIENLSSSSCGR